MPSEQNRLYKVFRAGGQSFPVYFEYDECPEYTDDGRPFATAEQESCPNAKSNAPGKPPPGDCGGCGWFFREETPYDPIGVCMCDARRSENESGTEETK
jgi:hypothetical protein